MHTVYSSAFLSLSVVAFTAAGLALLLAGEGVFPDFYDTTFMGWSALAAAFVILTPSFVLSVQAVGREREQKRRERSIYILQVALALGFMLNGVGALGLYQLHQVGIPYDKIVHFLSPFLFTIFVAYFLKHWCDFPMRRALIFASAAVFFGGIVWEFGEFTADALLGTSTFGLNGDLIVEDTVLDIFFNLTGIIAGVYAVSSGFASRVFPFLEIRS